MTVSSIFGNLLKLRKIPRYIRGFLFWRIIYIFQMGKVGSGSIYLAVHRTFAEQDKGPSQEKRNTMLFFSHRISLLKRSHRLMVLSRVKLGLPLKAIVPIREPIARDVSAFFHFYCQRVPSILENTSLRELEELFLADPRPKLNSPLQPARWAPHAERQFTLNWFDRHFKPLTRIDVYKQPFPIDRKWQIYRRGFTRVLVYRSDLKRSEQTKLVSDFLGIKLDGVRHEHGSGNLDYAEHYSRFRESTKLPEQYIRRMHDSRFARHFWSPAELKTAADKWRATSSS